MRLVGLVKIVRRTELLDLIDEARTKKGHLNQMIQEVSGDTMIDDRVACPRCGQDWLVHVRLVHVSVDAIFCPECEALWETLDDVGPKNFQDYATFMRRRGRTSPDAKGELKIGEQLRKV